MRVRNSCRSGIRDLHRYKRPPNEPGYYRCESGATFQWFVKAHPCVGNENAEVGSQLTITKLDWWRSKFLLSAFDADYDKTDDARDQSDECGLERIVPFYGQFASEDFRLLVKQQVDFAAGISC